MSVDDNYKKISTKNDKPNRKNDGKKGNYFNGNYFVSYILILNVIIG